MSGLAPLPIVNTLNAPAETCEAIKDRFLLFLEEFRRDEADGDVAPTQSQHSVDTGAAKGKGEGG